MKCLELRVVLVIVLSATSAAPISKAGEDDAYPPRLPRTSIPLRYELTISSKVNTGNTKFDGIVKIVIKMTEDADSITLNNKGLTVTSVKLTDTDSELDREVRYETDNDFMIIDVTSRKLVKDEQLTVEIAYTGELQLNMLGFYRSEYLGSDGKKK
jgi:aminopeptidase 2